jgi:hypothetical protein
LNCFLRGARMASHLWHELGALPKGVSPHN